MNIESSSEFQRIVLSTVIKDTYMFTRTSRYITEEFYDKYQYKLIYKSLKYYYDKYSKLPSLDELLVVVAEFNNSQVCDLNTVRQECIDLYNTPRYEENFVMDKITTFIRRNNVEKTLKDYLPKLNNGESIAIDTIGEELMKGLSFSIMKSSAFRLSDVDEISSVRKSAIGTEDNPLIIKSFIEGINQSLQFKGYKPGDLIMVCLVGSTKIMTLDGHTHTIEELYQLSQQGVNKGIYTIDPYEMQKDRYCAIEPTRYSRVELTKYVHDTVRLTLDNGAIVETTPDHRYLLRSGEYVEAIDLNIDDSLMPMYKDYRRVAPQDLVDKSEGYECVRDGNGRWDYTHRRVADTVPGRSELRSQIHHKNDDNLDNDFNNLEWISRSEHMSLTSKARIARGEVLGRPYKKGEHHGREIQKGEHLSPETEFTSEYIRDRNLRNWEDPEYRRSMTEHMRSIAKDPKIMRKRETSRVLKALNRLIGIYGRDQVTLDNYQNLVPAEGSRKPTLWNIADKFDCLSESNEIDLELLQASWEEIIEKSESFNHYIVNIEYIHYDDPIPVYDIINAGPYSNFAIDLGDESGIFVHNCAAPGVGKTMFMINEGANASMQGFKVLHLFLGDMKEYDGFVRYSSKYTQIPQDDIVGMSIEQQQEMIRKFNMQGYFSNIVVAAYAAGEITIDEMVQEVYRLQDENHMHFDMILVDYADNLLPDSDMMYESGGNIYNKLSLLGSKNRSVIIVGSQPKPAYWDDEIIPKNAAADSSRKQHVIDVMLTMGMTSRGSSIGSIFMPKVRRGSEGKIIRIQTYFERAHLEAISEQEYLKLKGGQG